MQTNRDYPSFSSSGRLSPDDFPSESAGFERLLDSEEAAQLLRIHPKTLQRMARSGEIRGFQIGKLWRFRASVLNEWLSFKLERATRS